MIILLLGYFCKEHSSIDEWQKKNTVKEIMSFLGQCMELESRASYQSKTNQTQNHITCFLLYVKLRARVREEHDREDTKAEGILLEKRKGPRAKKEVGEVGMGWIEMMKGCYVLE